MAAPALRLVLTEAGIARFTAAQLGQSVDLSLSTIGITATAIIDAPTLTALPGEFRRLPVLSGKQVGRDVAHLVLRDEEALAYTVRGIALYLADGTMFGVYAQAQPIVAKSAQSTLLLAIDIAFPANSGVAVTFGNTDFINPPATEETKGVVELATLAEAEDGAAGPMAVTAAVLKSLLDTIRSSITAVTNAAVLTSAALAALLARTIMGGGLVTGGGDHTASRILTVEAASADEADAGVIATKAVTPAALTNILAAIRAKVPLLRQVVTTGLATGGRTLEADVTINVAAATAAEADAGTIATKAVTPAALANFITAIADRVRLSRRIDTSGLALGGGSLTTDLTISVPAATAAQIRAGGASNVATTPAALAEAGAVYVVAQSLAGDGGYRVWSDGLKECWGTAFVPANGSISVPVPIEHVSFVVPAFAPGSNGQDEQSLGVTAVSTNGFSVRNRNPAATTLYWHTKGV